LVAAAGSITATPSGRRLVVNVSIADPTSTLSPSAVDEGRVNAARVKHELAVLETQLGVVAGNRRLTNEDMARGIASNRQ
jgi:hypothetical protein